MATPPWAREYSQPVNTVSTQAPEALCFANPLPRSALCLQERMRWGVDRCRETSRTVS
jgi:hypothetical protein